MTDKFYQILKNDYITIKDPISSLPTKLYRIVALKDFTTTNSGVKFNVKEGDIGGFIANESNLAQDGSFAFHESKIFGNAVVANGTALMQKVSVYQSAKVSNSLLKENARVYGFAEVSETFMSGNTIVCGRSKVQYCKLKNAARIDGEATVTRTEMFGGGYVTDRSNVNNSIIYDYARVYGNSVVENSKLKSGALLRDKISKGETLSHDIILNIESHAE